MAKKNSGRAVEFNDAADVARVMDEVAALWREAPLMTGVSLKTVIPFAQALATLAKEIQEIKNRLPPAEGKYKSNGRAPH